MNLKTLAVVAAIAVSVPAFAARVNITGYEPNSAGVKITIDRTISIDGGINVDGRIGVASRIQTAAPETVYEGEAGRFAGFLDGASFLTYCAEVGAEVVFGAPGQSTEYLLTAPDKPLFGENYAKRTEDLSRLFNAGHTFVTDAATSAAFQSAVWEILNESITNPYDLFAGRLVAAPENAGDLPAFNAINLLLGKLGDYAPIYHVDVLHNEQLQDYLVVSIPEPGTWAMILAGLAGIGFVVRRRIRRRG